jgi:hypothetical protein
MAYYESNKPFFILRKLTIFQAFSGANTPRFIKTTLIHKYTPDQPHLFVLKNFCECWPK